MSALIHIGANKSASTTLQRCLFAVHPELHYVGEDGAGYARYKELMTSFLWTDNLFWDRGAAERFFDQQKEMAAGKKLVFSSEDIMTSHIASQCLERLRFLVGEADILLVIRNQIDAVVSYYASHGAYLRPAPSIHFKRFVPLDSWLEYNHSINEYGALAGFDYWRFVDYCERIFGEGRVKILMFEDLISDRGDFYTGLAELLNISAGDISSCLENSHERKRHTWRRYHYSRILSALSFNMPVANANPGKIMFGDRFEGFLNGGRRISFELSDIWEKRLTRRYEQGNMKLASKYGLPLADYGYPLPE